MLEWLTYQKTQTIKQSDNQALFFALRKISLFNSQLPYYLFLPHFTDSYRILPILTVSYGFLPILTDFYRFGGTSSLYGRRRNGQEATKEQWYEGGTQAKRQVPSCLCHVWQCAMDSASRQGDKMSAFLSVSIVGIIIVMRSTDSSASGESEIN